METKTFLGAWGAYVLTTFVMGFVWHLLVFEELYRELAIFSRIDDPIVPLGFAAMVIQGFLLAYLYPRFSRWGEPWREGLRFGLLMGVFIASSAVLAEAAKQRVTSLPTWLIVETLYYLLQFALSGLVIALVYGRWRESASEVS